jgi:hypothetical protein
MRVKFWTEIVKIPLGRHRHKYEINIKMCLWKRLCEGVEWIVLVRTGDGGGLL